MEPGLRPSPGSPSRRPAGPSPARPSATGVTRTTQLQGGGGLTPALNRKVNKELAVIFNSPQVARAGQGSPPVGVTDESEGPPKAQVAPWTLGLWVLCVASR